MIRFILIILEVVLYLVITLPVLGILALLIKCKVKGAHKVAQAMVNCEFRIILLLTGSKVHRIGTENIPKDGAYMFAFNHLGIFDVLLIYSTVKLPTAFISKKQIRKVPILNWWMLTLSNFFLDRDDMREGVKMIIHSVECLKNGISIAIAPEGTRSRTGEMLPFKEGSFKMATKANVPIIPVAITGTDVLFENQFPRIKKTNLVVEFGKPIVLSELTPDELKTVGAYTQAQVAELLKGHDKYKK